MNEMNEFDQVIHRTWVQLLVDHGYREAAAIAIDMQVDIMYGDYTPDAIVLDVPISMYSRVRNDESLRKVMERALLAVCHGHLYDQNKNSVSVEDLPIEYRVKWDAQKAIRNKKKHRVTFAEAATVFRDPLALIFDDEEHSEEEHREIIIGHSSRNRLLIVSFTERKGAIRIISARKADRGEREDYGRAKR